jgi:TrpR family trp operon transcriptional repressor
MAQKRTQIDDLAQLLAAARTRGEVKRLLGDLLTPQEIEELALRWKIARELLGGRTQRDIAERLGVSISKITRASRAVQYGNGGFDLFARRLKKKPAPKTKKRRR